MSSSQPSSSSSPSSSSNPPTDESIINEQLNHVTENVIISDQTQLRRILPFIMSKDLRIRSLEVNFGGVFSGLGQSERDRVINAVHSHGSISSFTASNITFETCEVLAEIMQFQSAITHLTLHFSKDCRGSKCGQLLCMALSSDQTLEQLSIDSANIFPRLADANLFADTVVDISTLRSIDLCIKGSPQHNTYLYQQIAKRNPKLMSFKTLECRTSLASIISPLAGYSSLQCVHIGGEVNLESASKISQLLLLNKLTEFHLFVHGLPEEGSIEVLVDSLRANTSLVSFGYSGPNAVWSGVDSHSSIHTVEYCQLSTATAGLIPVFKNPNVTTLIHRSSSSSSSAQMVELIEIFKNCDHLTELSLLGSGCFGGRNSKYALDLLNILQGKSALKRLRWKHTLLTSDFGLPFLLSAFTVPSIEELQLLGGTFELYRLDRTLSDIVSKNTNLKSLDLRESVICEGTILSIFSGLARNSTLTRLDFDSMKMKEIILRALDHMLKINTTLRCITTRTTNMNESDDHSRCHLISIFSSLARNAGLVSDGAQMMDSTAAPPQPSTSSQPEPEPNPAPASTSSNLLPSIAAQSAFPRNIKVLRLKFPGTSGITEAELSVIGKHYQPLIDRLYKLHQDNSDLKKQVLGMASDLLVARSQVLELERRPYEDDDEELTVTPYVTREYLSPQSREFDRVCADFYESLAHMPDYQNFKFVLRSIQKVTNNWLERRFYQSFQYFHKWGYHSHQAIHSVYHGTQASNIDSILKWNLNMDNQGTSFSNDRGWFGAGMYFSRHADYVMTYMTVDESFKRVDIGDRGKILQFDIMPGRMYLMKKVKNGSARKINFDSHVSPSGFEYVMFDNRHILPRYVIEYEVRAAPGANFNNSLERKGPDSSSSYLSPSSSPAFPSFPPTTAAPLQSPLPVQLRSSHPFAYDEEDRWKHYLLQAKAKNNSQAQIASSVNAAAHQNLITESSQPPKKKQKKK